MHIKNSIIYDFYNYLDNYKESEYYKYYYKHYEFMKDYDEKILRTVDNPDDICKLRIETFLSIKKEGVKKPIEVILKDNKYYIINGSGRASALLFQNKKIPIKIINQEFNRLERYYYITEVEVLK